MTGDPVGLPGLLAMGVGFLAFLAAVILARSARSSGNGETTARRSRASIIGVAIQALAIGFASIGVQRATLDPLSAKALTE
ncbi:MAG: isoprenylcysteine carboxylmethyltransferase family protein, partial [Chthoniobacterales bacterium]